MASVRAGLFGLTHPHSQSHLKTLIASDLVDEVILYDEDAEVLSDFEAEPKVVGAFSDLDALLNRESITFGVACGRNDKNPDLCMALFENGVHVISEKPIGLSAQAVSRVVDGAAQAGVQLGVMYQNRYHPASQEARRLVGAGAIGDVTACESRMVTSQVKFRNPKHWLFDRSIAGGGILSWLGCHYIDLLCYILGQDIVSVSAMVDIRSGEDIDVEDVATLSFRFEDGTLGSMQAGYQLAISGAGYIGPNYDTYMGFRGRDGRLFWTPSGGTSELNLESVAPGWHTAHCRIFDYTLPDISAYGGAYGVEFVEDFIRACQGNGSVPASGEDALKVARIIEAAYLSSESGKHVAIEGV